MSLGLSFLREYKAWDARGQDQLAAADMTNLQHQVELAKDDIMNCDDDRALNRDYYLLQAYDESYQYLHSDTPEDHTYHASAVRRAVALLYYFGGAKSFPGDYVYFKGILPSMYRAIGKPYRSPDKGEDAPDAPAPPGHVTFPSSDFPFATHR